MISGLQLNVDSRLTNGAQASHTGAGYSFPASFGVLEKDAGKKEEAVNGITAMIELFMITQRYVKKFKLTELKLHTNGALTMNDSNSDEVKNQSAEAFVEFLPQLLAEVDDPEKFVVKNLIPEGALVLLHGHPRTMKSLSALEIGLAVVTGTPAFGLFPTEQGKVWYLTQEDGRKKVKRRLRRMVAGRGLKKVPKGFATSIFKNVNFDDEDKAREWEARIIAEIKKHGFKLIIFDPIRRFTANADKGSSEVSVITGILRRIVEATGASIIIVHHDTKPPRLNDVDNRQKAFRASGGDWFAACECPITFEQIDPDVKGESLLVPNGYKDDEDPKSFSVKYTKLTEDKDSPFLIEGKGVEVKSGKDLKETNKVLKFLQTHQGKHTTNQVSIGCGHGKSGRGYTNCTATLKALADSGQITMEAAEGKGRAVYWEFKTPKPVQTKPKLRTNKAKGKYKFQNGKVVVS